MVVMVASRVEICTIEISVLETDGGPVLAVPQRRNGVAGRGRPIGRG